MIFLIRIFIDSVVVSKNLIIFAKTQKVKNKGNAEWLALTVLCTCIMILPYDWIKNFWKVYYYHIWESISSNYSLVFWYINCHTIMYNVALFDFYQTIIIQAPCLWFLSVEGERERLSLRLCFSLSFTVIRCLLIWSKAFPWMLICSVLFNLINLLLFACP